MDVDSSSSITLIVVTNNMSKPNPLAFIETQELIQKLIENGYGDLIDCLLSNENKVYTKKGRLNKSSLCREMGFKGKQLEDALKEMRVILAKDLALEEEDEETN